ncbi:hypothetical protein D3C77_615370 [compost metagenome]
MPLVEADGLSGIQAQHQQRVIHRANLHRVLQHAHPALTFVAAYAEVRAQGTNKAFGGVYFEGTASRITGCLYHDFAAIQAQLTLQAVKVDIYGAVGIEFKLAAIAEPDLAPLSFVGSQFGHQRLCRGALAYGPARGADGQEHGQGFEYCATTRADTGQCR